MIDETRTERDLAPEERIRVRCRAMGIPSWQVDRAGLVIQEPDEHGLVGLFLRSQPMTDLVAAAVGAWNEQEEPVPAEIFPGCWVAPMVITRRRRRSGYVVGILVGQVGLHGSDFERICLATPADPSAARNAISKHACWTSESVNAIGASLRMMQADLASSSEQERTISGFTTHLTEAYETVELLYELGRSMSTLRQPSQFGVMTIERLHRITDFGWIAASFPSDGTEHPLATTPVIWCGGRLCDDEAVIEAARKYLAQNLPSCAPVIAGYVDGLPPAAGPQVVLQPITRKGRPVGLLMAGAKGGDDPQVSSYDTRLLESASGYLSAFLENAALYAEQNATFIGTLRAMTAAIDAKDRYTCGHSERVALLARQLAIASGFDEARADRVHIAGLVHDVGKIGVPESVLTKAGRLTDDEFGMIKLHPEIGQNILKDIPLFQDVLPGVMYHHERWDGKGYPHRLAGEAIPLIARFIGIADTFDAMSSTRSYRPALPREHTLAEIRKCAGAQFDPELAERFLTLDLSEYDQMLAMHTPQAPIEEPRLAA
ncbi:MAG: HD-GYP domain-containing protein [Phycisphaeraceae bacterium]|nr:HD-GYP domain-containing protein [Phycisphaeraceae bacterium]